MSQEPTCNDTQHVLKDSIPSQRTTTPLSIPQMIFSAALCHNDTCTLKHAECTFYTIQQCPEFIALDMQLKLLKLVQYLAL